MADVLQMPEQNFLSLEDILKADDLDYVDIEIPEWTKNGKPGVIRLRAMSAEEAISFTKEGSNNTDAGASSYVRIVASTAIDPVTGDKLFRTPAQVAMLRSKKSGIFIRLQREAMKLNNIGQQQVDAKND